MMTKAILQKRNGENRWTLDVPDDVFVVKFGGSYFVNRNTEFKNNGIITFVETDMLCTNRADEISRS